MPFARIQATARVPPSLKTGQRVFGKWKGGSSWHPATVTKVHAEDYDIRYDTGWHDERTGRDVQTEKHVEIRFVIKVQPSDNIVQGQRVLSKFQGGIGGVNCP